MRPFGNRATRLCAAACLALPIAAPLWAQAPAPAAAAAAEKTPFDAEFDIEWKENTTLGEVAALVRMKTRANIVADLRAERVAVPGPVKFRNVTAKQLFVSLGTLTQGAFAAAMNNESGVSPELPPGAACMVLKFQDNGQEIPKKTCRVFASPVKDDTFPEFAARAIEAIEAAVDTRNEAERGSSAPLVKTHPKSGLLFVAGTEKDVALAAEVLEGLDFEAVAPPEPQPRADGMIVGPGGVLVRPASAIPDDPEMNADIAAIKRIVLALQAYAETRKGKLPSTLGALTPQYLEPSVLIRDRGGFELEAPGEKLDPQAGSGQYLVRAKRSYRNGAVLLGAADGSVVVTVGEETDYR